MLSLLLALVTSAPVTAPSGPALVVVTEQTGLTQSEVVDLGETLARLLREGSVRIPLAPGELPVRLTAKDLPACQRFKGKARQRCIGALGKQMGAATVVAIEGGKLLDEYTIIVDLLDAEDGRVLFNRDTSFKSGGRKALERALKPIATEISKLIAMPEEPPAEAPPPPPPPPPKEQMTSAPPTNPVTPPQENTAPTPSPPPVKPPPEPRPLPHPPRTLRAWSWLPAMAGVGLAAGGGFALKQAKGNYDALATGSAAADRARAYRDNGKNQQRLGIALVSAGAVGLAAAGVMFFADQPSARVTPALMMGSGEMALTFIGTWP